MEHFTKEQANVLTRKGFFNYFNQVRPGTTREKAYEQTEAIHRQIHLDGEPKYSDFSSFDRDARHLQKQLSPS